MNKIKFEIKNKWTGSILFEYEKENNTLKDTIEEAVERGANLRGANLGGAYLKGAYLKGADLEGADLEGANLKGANLEGADLEGANLKGANLEGAYLKGAYLKGAILEGADLEGANLKGAKLEGAYMKVSDDEIDVNYIIEEFKENSNIEIIETYINKDIIPTRWSVPWKYGLIIRNWKIKEKEVEEMTLAQICKELGRNIKIVKENGGT